MHRHFPTGLKLASTLQHFKIGNQPKVNVLWWDFLKHYLQNPLASQMPPLQRSARHRTLTPTFKTKIPEDQNS